MANNKKLGLPGGPNEYITHVSDLFSTEGYKRNSPDVNNPFNIIPSGNITMEGVDFPVMGTDNLGNSQMMTPGNNYEFPGDQVFEVPMAKTGGGLLDKTMKCNSCSWEWKAADGGADVSTCHKCGSSALPKAQYGTAVKAIGKQAAKYSDKIASLLKNFLNNADNITSSEPIINNARKNLTQFINDPIKMNNPFGFQRIGDTQPLSDLSLLNPKNIDLTKGFDNYTEELFKRQREYGIKHTNENLSENFFEGKARVSNQLNENITPFGKALGSGMEGTVYEFANYPEFVLKHARNYSPNRSDINLPLEAMSFRNNATAIPLKAQKIFDKFNNTEGAISLMDNLNKVGLDSPLQLSKRDAYADLLKRVRKLRDSGIRVDVNNTSNIRFNKDKGVYDIFDLERGKGNPKYMKWIDQQLRTGQMIPDKGSQFDFMYGGSLPKAQGGIETEFPKFNLSNQNLNLDERANNLTVQDNIPSSQSLKVIPELYEDNYSVTGKQPLQPQTGNDMVSAYDEPDTYDKVTDILASPLTSLSYFLSGQDIPDSLPLGIPGRNPHDAIIDMFNPFAMAKYAVQSNKTFDNAKPLSFNSTTGGIDGLGEYVNSGLEALGAIPIVPAWLKYGKNLNSPIIKAVEPTALAPVANTVKKTSNVVNDAWKVKPLPGLHLKSTMDNGAISKIIEPKTGRINTEQALAIIKKESGGLEKVDFIKKQFGDAIPKKIDYNEFRTIVQKSLVPLELKINPDGSADYGLENLGYGSFWTNNKGKNLESAGILENNALTISNRTQFGGGSSMHGNPDDTLGHVHFLRDVDNPQTLTVTQIQSDAFQGGYATMPKTKEAANFNIAQNEKHLEGQKRIWNSAVQQPDGSWLYPSGDFIPDAIHIQGVQGQEAINAMQRAEAKNLSQKQLLKKNHQERYLQEIVNYAAQRGDLNKIRIPTMETAAKVQNYIPNIPGVGSEATSSGSALFNLQTMQSSYAPGSAKFIEFQTEIDKINNLRPSFNLNDYGKMEQSILKKYKDQTKNIKKLYGQDVITVTDAKGNTWYEFDIPKSFKSGTGEIKAFKEGGSLPKAQNAGEDVQNAQQDVQNRAVIFAEAPEYTTYQYDIDTPIYDNEGNLIANYPSELETLYNNYNQSESEIEDINNKKIAEKKASSYLQFLIHEKDKMKRQHDAMYKEFEKNGYYEGLENESRLVEFQEKYQNLGDQIGQFTAQIYNRDSEIDKKYNAQLDELYFKNSNAYTDFYDNERNSQIKNTDSTFYKEAQNLQRVYEKLQPNTNVEIVPIFRDPDIMREKVADLNKNDAMFLFGHSGSRLGGIPNNEIASIFQESKAENCYLGSCDFEGYIEPYTNMVGKNVNYRPLGAWWGVNPNGSTIDEAMWSRVTDPTTGNIDPTVKRTAKIITPTLGVDYQTKKLKKGGGIEKYTMYKDYVNGIYTGDKKESIAQKNYDRLNRLHYREAKTNQMTPANYILSYLME